MNNPTVTPLQFTYERVESGISVLAKDDVGLQEVRIKHTQYVILRSGAVGGNHKHPRTEWFVAVGDGLVLYWLDKDGERQQILMNPDGHLCRIEIPPYVPHAVVNHGKSIGILLEYADARMSDVERIEVFTLK